MADFIDRQRRKAQQGLAGLRSTLRNTPTNPLASPGARPRGYGIAGINQAPVTMRSEGKPPEPSGSFRDEFRKRITAAKMLTLGSKQNLQKSLRSGVVAQPKPLPPVPPPLYNQSPGPVAAPLAPRDASVGALPLPRPVSLGDREPTSLMPPTIARNDSTAELMASRRTLRQNPLDLAKVRQSQTPTASSMMQAEADRLNRASARVDATIDTLDERMAEGRAKRRADFNRDRAAYQNKIENMTPDEFREEVSSTNRGSGNYFDMTKRGPYGITDVVVRPRSAKENFDSRLANMSPEELKKEAFTSRESGLMGRGPYGGRPTYSAEGSLAGRENALAAPGALAPTTQMRAEAANAEADARRRARNEAAGRSGEDMGTFYNPLADSNDDGQISDSEMAAVEARMRTRRAERLGLPTTPQEKAQAFQAQRDRRAQRREDALATRRSMLPYRTRGIPMNAIFLDESGRADPLMNAGMFREASNRDQANAQRAELARQFDAEQATRDQTVANQKLEIENRNSYNTERNEIERKRVEGEISNNEANREMDQARLKFEQKEARRQRRQEQRDKEKFEEIEDVEVYGAQNESLAQNKSPVQGMYREGTGSERIENLQRVLASESLTPSEKKRLMAYQFGITDQEQLNQLLYDAGYEGEGFAPNEYSGSAFNPFNFLNAYQSPRTYRIRDSILSNSAMAFAAE